MKIFFCLKYFLPDHVAGTEIYVSALASGLQKSGHEVAVIKPTYVSGKINTYYHNSIRVLEYPETPVSDAALQTGKKFPPGIKIFKELLEEEKPDIIHFHEISGSNGITIEHVRMSARLGLRIFVTFHLTRYVCKRSTLLFKGTEPCDGVITSTKCPVCLLEQKNINLPLAYAASYVGSMLSGFGTDFSDAQNRMIKLLNYPAYILKHKQELQEIVSMSEKTVALNDWFFDMLVSNDVPEEKLVSIPNTIPYETTQQIIKEERDDSKIRLVYIGRICRIKGLKILLAALNAIGAKNVTLDIYGSVTEHDYFDECLKMSASNKNISWKGILPPTEVIPGISKYDLLVFPSQVEEMSPFIIMESFAAGVPVLATNLRASRSQIRDGVDGWLFSFLDKNDLEKKLRQLLADPAQIKMAAENILPVALFGKILSAHQALYKIETLRSLPV